MSMDLTGITNKNEYYTNHYFSTVFEENAGETISAWNTAAKESEEVRTPWSLLRRNAVQYNATHQRFDRASLNMQALFSLRELADSYLKSLGYPEADPQMITIDEKLQVPVYLEMKKPSGAPLLWIVLMASTDDSAAILDSYPFDAEDITDDSYGAVSKGIFGETVGEELATKILFAQEEPPRFLMMISADQIALIDRNKWNEKRYLQFEMSEIFRRLENTTLQAMSVLLHRDSLCPDDGKVLLDELDEQSQKNASGVSQDLKYALRESIELLGNEVLYDMKTRLHRDLEADPVDAGQLTLECLRYMYRMLFVLFIEARPELGYAPIKAQSYYTGYSLESLRDIADDIRDDVDEVGDGYYLHETLAKLYDLIYNGYPKTEEELKEATGSDSIHDMFLIAPLKAHIFDPEFTKMLTAAKLRNSCMLRIIELMSSTKASNKKNSRRGRISYANLGINQLGAVYEALLSYRGFIAEQDLYEVKRAGDTFNELDVGYFVSENELDQYTEEERVRYESGEKKGKLRMYKKGSFIYRLAGREREKSASYYTPEVLTKCLVKYALKELLEGKTADDILSLTICEPAMGSAAFLNEAINQLAEAYITKKEQETGVTIGYEDRFNELQKVKMFIADRNVYGIDLNPVAVELAEVSLWLNTIHEGGFVPWFGTQLVNGNSLIGARRQAYRVESLTTTSKGLRWYENAPDRVPLGTKRMPKKQVYHFLLGDPGMCNYTDKVIKSLEPDNIKKMKDWNKKFNAPYEQGDINTLLRLSEAIDNLWEAQINLRKEVELKTQDKFSVFGHDDDVEDSHTTIRQKDKILSELYKSEHMRNAGPYARLKFAMDYWCSLWFWPIDKADLLPTRSEFFFDMSLILEGTIDSVNLGKQKKNVQLFSLFPTEMEEMAVEILDKYGTNTVVDIPGLRATNPRLDLAYQIAEQNKFMHWELEFADLFAEKSGFDLVIGNPPWVLLGWNEQDLLADYRPVFAIRNISAADTATLRSEELRKKHVKVAYISEYENISGMESFYCAMQNYKSLSGMKTNLYKCFLPQAWLFGKDDGVSAFIHPEGVYDDPKGNDLRKELYPRLRRHYQFRNEFKLFSEVHHSRVFGLNVYCNKPQSTFDSINNLFSAETIDECYSNRSSKTVGIKDEEGNWTTYGNYDRILKIGSKQLETFGKVFDIDDWRGTKLLALHSTKLLNVISVLANQPLSVGKTSGNYISEMWNETNAQRDGTISRKVGFPKNISLLIMAGSQIGVSTPLLKTPRRICNKNSDFDTIDLMSIPDNYLPRSNYIPGCELNEYYSRIPIMDSGIRYDHGYRIFARKMIDPEGSRTLVAALMPPLVGHTSGISGIYIPDERLLLLTLGSFCSLPIDYLLKATAKANFQASTIRNFPIVCSDSIYANAIIARVLQLNAVSDKYDDIWKHNQNVFDGAELPSKQDVRVTDFTYLSEKKRNNLVLKNDYARRLALVEIDVLVSMAFGITLEELLTMYILQFHILQGQEEETWYDRNGRIVYTNNRALTGVGFSRSEWENGIKGASAGEKYYRTITDDTIPGGPVDRIIEYVAPFDRCDREQDYETAWKFFEEKYGDQA